MKQNTLFEIKTPRAGKETPEQAATVFSALASQRPTLLSRLTGRLKPFFFEIAGFDQSIHFYASVPQEVGSYFTSQLTAQYPQAQIIPATDYLTSFPQNENEVAQLALANYSYYPLKAWRDVGEDTDPLSPVLGVLANLNAQQRALVQLVVVPASASWQERGRAFLTTGIQTPEGGTRTHPKAALVERKLGASQAFVVGIRLLVHGETKADAQALLGNLTGSFGAFSLGEGNALVVSNPFFFRKKQLEGSIIARLPKPLPQGNILTVDELATLWHLPTEPLSRIPTISWGGKLMSEPPENLPIGTSQEKDEINFFARADFKGKPTVFGVKRVDRRRHMYLIGKTGTGKSTLIANMAINDMRNREGVAVIDPHGDLSDILLDYVPSFRINDIVYLDAADRNYPFHLNLFEGAESGQHDLIASGIVAIFYKLYHYSWGPRLEYVFRNAILTLLEQPGSTLVDIPRLLTDRGFREKIVSQSKDRILVNFWKKEFEGMGERLQAETISPILNKVGQFVSSPLIRNIIGHPRSTINLGKIMNEGKILVLNLSQGKLGEDNSSLLGAMVVTKLQLAAMERVNVPESERRDFFLYVDEFQNFATTSFIKILSEARKYRLSLVLANQYIAQVPEDVQKAILGNVGSLVSFVVSAQDAHVLAQEFGDVYKEEDLVALDNWQVVVKMAIEGKTSRPFVATTLPLPRSRNKNRAKIINVSRERYAKPLTAHTSQAHAAEEVVLYKAQNR
ncbi:ATP-binding protein [Candidatus Microgenomates bacterium]|nr:ATP-binding protein [Candidatus Microgenomates bacterium]